MSHEIEPDMKPSACKHLHAHVYGWVTVGRTWCPDCSREVYLYEVFENLIKALRKKSGIKEFYDEKGETE